MKYVASYNDEVLPESTDDLAEIDYVEISGVSLAGGIEETNRMTFFEAPSRARRKVRSGDILISTVRTYLRAIAAVDNASDDLIASTGFCVVRPRWGADSGFLGWVAKSEPFVSEVVARSVGVSYPAINASELVTISVPLPPLETQRRIARFLGDRTARIDGLVEKKRTLLCRIRPQEGLAAYFGYQLNRNPQLLKYNDGKEQTHLSNSDFKLVQLLFPPEDEQRSIVDHLDHVDSSIGETCSKVQAGSGLIQTQNAMMVARATAERKFAASFLS